MADPIGDGVESRHVPKLVRWFLAMDDRQNESRLFGRIAIGTALLIAVVNTAAFLAQPDTLGRVVQNVIVVFAMAIGTRWLASTGRVRVAAWVYLSVLILLVTINALPFGGIRSPGVPAFMIIVVLAGLLLGQRAGVITACVCALFGLGLLAAEGFGLLGEPALDYSPLVRWLLICMYMGVALLAMYLATERVQIALARAERELEERQVAEAALERVATDLGERMKELQLLHDAAHLLDQRSEVGQATLQQLVARMPAGWFHPDDACARITLGDVIVSSGDWQETPWVQSVSFATAGGRCTIEVAYAHEHAQADEGPFLAEERSVLDSLAEMLRTHIDRDALERHRLATESQLRQVQKMEALGTLAGGIAHDFNNILGSIGGNAELAALEATPGSRAEDAAREILIAHARASDLVRQILLFARQQEASRQQIALAPIIEEALQLLRATLPPSIEIRANLGAALPPVRADSTQMHQVVMNLATNAVYAMLEKGGTLTVELDSIRVGSGATVAKPTLPDGLYLRLKVSDTGSGMTPEVLERLFEPFFTTKGASGTGLGLPVVHGIVREHGGEIEVASRLGAGSEFVIYLPADESATVQLPAEAPTHVRGAGESVMYVDDEPNLCAVTRRMLTHLGYQPATFTTGEAALEAFRASPHAFDMVISDLQMPAMSGLELAKAIREIRPGIPIAIVSGFVAEQHASDPRAAEVTWLSKPISLDGLGRALNRMLGGSPGS